MKRSQRAIIATALALVLVGVVVSLAVVILRQAHGTGQPKATSQPKATEQPGPRSFHVEGNKIIGPDGRPFIVKGVTTGYGAFERRCPEAAVNSTHIAQDMDAIKALGMNTVRLFVSGKENQSMSNYLARVDQFV